MNEPEIVVDFAAEETVALTEDQQNVVDPMNSGFLWYLPPMASPTEHDAVDGHKWTIAGHDMQILTTTVPPGETVVTEVGSFMFGSPDIKTSVELTLCARGGCGEGWQRICGGESCAKVLLLNESNAEGFVGLTPNFPAKVIPIQFGKHIRDDTALISQGGAYMSHLGDVDVGTSYVSACKRSFFTANAVTERRDQKLICFTCHRL